MRPLARLHAITDHTVLADPDLPIRAAALAAAGPAVALHVRDHDATGLALSRVADRFLALARPPEASVFVNGRPDIARAAGAHGVQLGSADLTPADARTVFGPGWIGRSVHSMHEATEARDQGADFLLVGSIFDSASHPGRPPAGIELVRTTTALGLPVIAIGGITPDRAAAVRDAGAWGVAAIGALWRCRDSARAASQFLSLWVDHA